MSFLHPEFFYWMVPPVAVLFYFWQTQKSFQSVPFSEAALERLHSPEITMGLQKRNTLFLIAALFLITAMAQPVILQKNTVGEGRADVLIALDLSKKSLEAFEAEKVLAIEVIHALKGENIGLIGYDERLYRISPATTDTAMMVALIEGIDSDVMQKSVSDVKKVQGQNDETVRVIIGDPVQEHNTQLPLLKERVEKIKNTQRLYYHVPLFYYPLGLAMLLIGMALSTMSKRHSVPLASVWVILSVYDVPINGGILDFQELGAGYKAYERGDYSQSAVHFKYYQKEHDSPEIRYNIGNAYYKAGEYEKARYWYGRVYTNKSELAKRTLHNLGIIGKKTRKDKREMDTNDTEILHQFIPTLSSQKRVKRVVEKEKTRLYPI